MISEAEGTDITSTQALKEEDYEENCKFLMKSPGMSVYMPMLNGNMKERVNLNFEIKSADMSD